MINLPPPAPFEVDEITSHTADLITYPFLLKACYAWVNWKIACGVPVDQFQQRPEAFVTEADLERLVNVVSNWPRAAALRPPTLAMLIDDLRTLPGDRPVTFLQRLLTFEDRINAWMVQNGVDPAHPNESKEDKLKRQAAKRQREWRQRHSQPKTGDGDEVALVEALRTAAANLSAGRAWIRQEEKDAKLERDRIIGEARSACAARIQAGRKHVDIAELLVHNAQHALDQYRANK